MTTGQYVIMERTFHDNKKADSPSVLNPYVTLTSELPGVLTLINMSANIAGFFTPDLTTFFPFSIKKGSFNMNTHLNYTRLEKKKYIYIIG